MEQINNAPYQPLQVTVVPDAEERRQIRKKYSRVALILIMNLSMFNIIGYGTIYLVCAMIGGGISADAINAGSDILAKHEVISTLLSCMPPIISETSSILLGMKLMKIDLRQLISNREGYGGGTVAKLITLCLGLQFVASITAALIEMILESFGIKSPMPDLSATTSFWANVIMSFYACLLGPVLEELLYRGILLGSMRKYNERFAIFLSAAVFGLMHQNYQQFMLGFLIGIPLAVVTLKYNSLLPSIFTHIFANTTAMLSTYLLQYYAPEMFNEAINGGEETDISLSGAGTAVILLIVLFRIATLIAGLVVGIVSLVKGGNMKRPTPAGKTRGFPILARSVPWWILFALYIFMGFVYPFIRQA